MGNMKKIKTTSNYSFLISSKHSIENVNRIIENMYNELSKQNNSQLIVSCIALIEEEDNKNTSE